LTSRFGLQLSNPPMNHRRALPWEPRSGVLHSLHSRHLRLPQTTAPSPHAQQVPDHIPAALINVVLPSLNLTATKSAPHVRAGNRLVSQSTTTLRLHRIPDPSLPPTLAADYESRIHRRKLDQVEAPYLSASLYRSTEVSRPRYAAQPGITTPAMPWLFPCTHGKQALRSLTITVA
jgi:hypothetical protein